jgi:hypothetical protein
VNWAVLHLMLNTLPPIVSGIAAVALTIGLIWRSNDVLRFGLLLVIAVPLLIVPVFFSGRAAVILVGNMPGVPLQLIGDHQESVVWTWTTSVVAGCAALLGAAVYRRSRLPAWFIAVALALSLVTDGFVIRTAHLGGRIRHPEVRPHTPSPP